MQLDIDKEVALLQRMTVGQLRERFEETWGEPTNTRNKQWLLKRIAWKMQANIEGDISERARRRAAELARGTDIRTTAPKATKPVTNPVADTVTGFVEPGEDSRLPNQYFYDNNLTDGAGLDSATGLSVLKLATGGSGSFNVTLANAITKLADTEANGGAGITFNASSPCRATVTVKSEDEISFAISDAAGRNVTSGKLNNYRGSGATAVSSSMQRTLRVLLTRRDSN